MKLKRDYANVGIEREQRKILSESENNTNENVQQAQLQGCFEWEINHEVFFDFRLLNASPLKLRFDRLLSFSHYYP